MSKLDRIQGAPTRGAGRAGEVSAMIPPGLPPVLRRFWDFARKMAKEFSKNLLKAKEEDFLKVVRRDFDKWR